MNERYAQVLLDGKPVGTLKESYGQTQFKYADQWLQHQDAVPVSLTIEPNRYRRLTPAYDQVCTELVIPDDSLALTVGGRASRLTRKNWLDFATYCEIPLRAAERLISEQISFLKTASDLIDESYLPSEMNEKYRQIVETNTATLKKS